MNVSGRHLLAVGTLCFIAFVFGHAVSGTPRATVLPACVNHAEDPWVCIDPVSPAELASALVVVDCDYFADTAKVVPTALDPGDGHVTSYAIFAKRREVSACP